MIFSNDKNVDIELDVKENTVVEQWIITSRAKHSTKLVGLHISDAVKILEEQGFKWIYDPDPF